jgi:O-antigen/teichoic acid export membrane protein
MTNTKKRIKELFFRFKDLTTIGLANILSNGISVIFWLYVASLLGAEQYGEISYFIAIAGIASTVSLVGVGSTLIIYTAKEIRIQATLFFIAIVSSMITAIIVYFLYSNIGISFYIIGIVIFTLATSEILGRKLYSDYSKYMISQRILMVVFSLGFYFLIGPTGILIGMALAFFPYLFRIYKGFKETKIEFSLVKPRLGFMANSYFLQLSASLSGNLDKIIIGPLFGFIILGNYHLALQLLAILGILPSIVYQYILPREASGLSNTLLKKLTVLASIVLAIIGMGLGPIVLPILFPEFIESTDIVKIVSLAVIPMTIITMYISKFLAQEKSKIVFVGSGIYLITIVLGIIVLGKYFGVNGIAAALVISNTVEAIYLVIIDKFVNLKESDSNSNTEIE